MVLKFHMQHDKTAGLQAGRELNKAAVVKNSLTTKINFSSRTTEYLNKKFVWSISCTLIFRILKMKKSIAEQGNFDLLPVYEPYFA